MGGQVAGIRGHRPAPGEVFAYLVGRHRAVAVGEDETEYGFFDRCIRQKVVCVVAAAVYNKVNVQLDFGVGRGFFFEGLAVHIPQPIRNHERERCADVNCVLFGYDKLSVFFGAGILLYVVFRWSSLFLRTDTMAVCV